jgi:hypothetical protein
MPVSARGHSLPDHRLDPRRVFGCAMRLDRNFKTSRFSHASTMSFGVPLLERAR